MDKNLLLGIWRYLLPVPPAIWRRQVGSSNGGGPELAFMSADHHRVRDFVVVELPRAGQPLSPQLIAHRLELPPERVLTILDELERHKTFLFRNLQGDVAWAYPVTVEVTPHRVIFSSGEQVYAAWAVDAIAVPFVQGQLRGEPLSFSIQTECAHCHAPIHLEIDSELNYRVLDAGAQPLIFAPMVDVHQVKDPSIIDAFWRKSVFFWSEEHANEYRRSTGGTRGTYLTLEQSVYVTRLTQGALFALPRSAPGAAPNPATTAPAGRS